MRMVQKLAASMAREMAAGTAVILRWVTFDGATTADPTTGATFGTETQQSETVKGFVHFLENTGGVRLFQEMEAEDVIVDLPAATVIEGRAKLKFEIEGRLYVQKPVGEKVAKHWDAVVGGIRLGRTLLLRLET